MQSTSIVSIILCIASVSAQYSYKPSCPAYALVDNNGKCCTVGQILDYGICCDPPATPSPVATTTVFPTSTTTVCDPAIVTPAIYVPTTTGMVQTNIITSTSISPATTANDYYNGQTTTPAKPTGYSSQQNASNAFASTKMTAALFLGIMFALIC